MTHHSLSPAMDRRHWFRSAAAMAAGGALLADAAASQDNPASQVEDRGTNIRIASLKATRVGTKAYVKVETNRDIAGWGEVTGLEPNVAVALAHSLFELLDGENPTRIEHLWQKLYRSHRDMRGGPFMVHVISAIDMALWDITGKAWGVPVYRLLGGPTRDKVRVYPTPKAHKAGTGGPHPFSGDPPDIERLVQMVKHTRERVGPDGTVMFDAHCAVPPAMLIQLAAAIEPYDILFLEEVAVPGNIEVFKRLKEQIRIPMATGERDRTIWGMIPYLQERCIDILQPDVGHTGGISQMKKIATLAEAYFVPLAPHNTCSQLGVSASLHVAASIPFLLIHEMYLDGHIMPEGVARVTWTVGADGHATLPQEPGLGVTIDESTFEKLNADPQRRFKWPTPTLPDGAVRDY
ncbi:MAG: mandelate racemase/muconate lactonizing enzyme family protein [Planctomycetes bacterium]|nr:mandelate racemase/muconate lactonizing enzyme family protein [Planctomycetota bacterium]